MRISDWSSDVCSSELTADRRGDGWLVLFHTTANTDWSNLPISGLFVEMLRRVMAVSQGVGGAGSGQALPPLETMDGFGTLGAPPPTVLALPTGENAGSSIGPRHPPGYYGNASVRPETGRASGRERVWQYG